MCRNVLDTGLFLKSFPWASWANCLYHGLVVASILYCIPYFNSFVYVFPVCLTTFCEWCGAQLRREKTRTLEEQDKIVWGLLNYYLVIFPTSKRISSKEFRDQEIIVLSWFSKIRETKWNNSENFVVSVKQPRQNRTTRIAQGTFLLLSNDILSNCLIFKKLTVESWVVSVLEDSFCALVTVKLCKILLLNSLQKFVPVQSRLNHCRNRIMRLSMQSRVLICIILKQHWFILWLF